MGVTGRSFGGEPKTGVSRLDGCRVLSFSPDLAGVVREGAYDGVAGLPGVRGTAILEV